MVAQFTTMGDLVNYGYTKLDRLVDDSRYCNNAVEILQDTQEKLARFALKLKDTEFTVYDVRVDRLALSAEARRWVNLQGITELRNLYNMNDNVIKDKLKGSKDGGRIYDSINAALKQFGVNIDRNEERVMEKSVSQHTTSAAIEQKAKRQSAGKMFPSIKASIRIYRENSAGSEK
jgi:hypothetical protein